MGKNKTLLALSRQYIFDKYKMICNDCGCICNKIDNDPRQATLDHIKPLAKGGEHTYDNVQLLCRSCNSIKSDSYVIA